MSKICIYYFEYVYIHLDTPIKLILINHPNASHFRLKFLIHLDDVHFNTEPTSIFVDTQQTTRMQTCPTTQEYNMQL